MNKVRRQIGRFGMFKRWFNSYEDYFMRFDKNRLFMNVLYFVIITLLTVFIYAVVDAVNGLNLLILRVGSVLLVIGIYFSIEFFYLVIRDLRKWYHNLRKGFKALLAILVILIVILIVLSSSVITDFSRDLVDSFDFYDFNIFSGSITIGQSNVVDPNAVGSIYDLRSLVNFLPLPWGYVLLWVVLCGLLLLLLVKFVFFGELPNWLILVLVFLFLIMVFQYKVPYDFIETNGIGSCDERGNLVFDSLAPFFNSPCLTYGSSECRPICQSKKTVCQCEATLFDFTFRRDGNYFGYKL